MSSKHCIKNPWTLKAHMGWVFLETESLAGMSLPANNSGSGMFQSLLRHVYSPAWTRLENSGSPSPSCAEQQSRLGAILSRWGSGGAGAPRVPQGEVREGVPQQANRGAPAPPRARAGTPLSQPLWDRSESFHSGLARKPPHGGPGKGSGTHAVSRGLGGLSPASSWPLGV